MADLEATIAATVRNAIEAQAKVAFLDQLGGDDNAVPLIIDAMFIRSIADRSSIAESLVDHVLGKGGRASVIVQRVTD